MANEKILGEFTYDDLDSISYALSELIADKTDYRDRLSQPSEITEMDEQIEHLEAVQAKVGAVLVADREQQEEEGLEAQRGLSL